MFYILAAAVGILVGAVVRGLLERTKDHMEIIWSSRDADMYPFEISGQTSYKNVYFIPLSPNKAMIMGTNDTEQIETLKLLEELGFGDNTPEMKD